MVIFKVGDDFVSIANAAPPFPGPAEDDGRAGAQRVRRSSAVHRRRVDGRGHDPRPGEADRPDPGRLRHGDGEARPDRRLAADPRDRGPDRVHQEPAMPHAAAVQRDARIAQAEANRLATEAEQKAAARMSEATRDSEILQAGYQAERDKAAAKARQAGPLPRPRPGRRSSSRRPGSPNWRRSGASSSSRRTSASRPTPRRTRRGRGPRPSVTRVSRRRRPRPRRPSWRPRPRRTGSRRPRPPRPRRPRPVVRPPRRRPGRPVRPRRRRRRPRGSRRPRRAGPRASRRRRPSRRGPPRSPRTRRRWSPSNSPRTGRRSSRRARSAFGNVDHMVLLNGADGMSEMFAKALTMGGTGPGPGPPAARVDGNGTDGERRRSRAAAGLSQRIGAPQPPRTAAGRRPGLIREVRVGGGGARHRAAPPPPCRPVGEMYGFRPAEGLPVTMRGRGTRHELPHEVDQPADQRRRRRAP